MADTLTAAKGFTKQTVGGNRNTWGGILNNTIDLLDSALGGTLSKFIAGDTTLSSTEAQNAGYHFTGTLSSDARITFPSFHGMAAIRNATIGGYSTTCGIISGDASVTVLNGETVAIWSDGTDFVRLSQIGGGVGTTGTGTIVQADSPHFTGKVSIQGSDGFSQLGLKYDGSTALLLSAVNSSGSNYVFRVYPSGYMSLNTSSADGFTQGPPIVVGFDNASPTNGDYLGHFAYQGHSATDGQLQTMSFMEAQVTDVNPAHMKSQWRVGVMHNAVSSPPTVAQPNLFMNFDGASGLVVPTGINAAGNIIAGLNLGANGKNVIANGAGLTQIYDDGGNLAVGLASGYNAYQNTEHIFGNIGGGSTFATVSSAGLNVTASIATMANFVANNKSVLTNGAGLTQIYDDGGNLAVGLASGYNAYSNTQHLFTNANGSTTFMILENGVFTLPTLPTSDPHVAGHIWSNSGVLTVSAG